MKQMLKETILLWVVIILILASICILIGVPFVFLPYIGIRGELQVLVSALWLTFWFSFAVAVVRSIDRKMAKIK